jgi:hypothetical protein
MAKPQVLKIYIVGGKPDNFKQPAKHADVIVWIPETPDDLIDITFDDGSPFGVNRITADFKGEAVGAVVVASPLLNTEYTYSFSANGLRLEAEPEIIVDGGGGPGPDPGGKGGPKKPGRKRTTRAAKKS